MNELDAVRTLDDTVPWRDDELHDAARRLRSAIAADAATHRLTRRRLTGSRHSLRWVGAAVAAAIVIAVATAGVLHAVSGDHHQAAASGSRPTDSGGAARIEPAAFLMKAAGAAAARADFVPRPDQFLYIQQTGYQAWLSIDGTHDGLIDNGDKIADPGCRDGVAMVAGNYAGLRPQPCRADPAYLADAPTTPEAMAQYILTQAGSSAPNNVGKEVLYLAEFHYLRPAAQAALYEAAHLLPQLTLSASTVSNLNRAAVAITWSFDGDDGVTLLFDATTYTYLGVLATGPKQTPGQLNGYRQAIVDAVGQVP